MWVETALSAHPAVIMLKFNATEEVVNDSKTYISEKKRGLFIYLIK